MAIGSVISYKKNEIRLVAANLITGAFLYTYLVHELIAGSKIISYSRNSFYVGATIFASESIFCLITLILGVYQSQYNRRLAKSGMGINKWFLSERTFNYLTVTTTILFGLYLVSLPVTEMHSGLATGGLFFENHRLNEDLTQYWQLIYFHFAISILPFFGGLLLLIFPPQKDYPKVSNKERHIREFSNPKS